MPIVNKRKYIVIACMLSTVGFIVSVYRINDFRMGYDNSKHFPLHPTIIKSEPLSTGRNNQTGTGPVTRLNDACRNIDMDSSAFQGWPKPSYPAVFDLNLMFCPMKLVKVQFWKDFYKVLKKAGRKKGPSKDSNERLVYFGEENAKLLKLIVPSINPFTWLLHGYVEKSLLGMDICKETSLQRFLDKVISGVKLRQNQGLTFTPTVPLCRPCDVNVHSIIRYENFESDVTSVLHSLELDNIKPQILKDDKDSTIRGEVIELPLMAIRHYRSHDCSNMSYLLLRILEAFKIKGFLIPSKLKSYISDLKNLRLQDVRASLSTLAYGTVSMSSDSLNKIQNEYYSRVSKETLQYIQSMYRFEFEAFGYNNIP